MKRGGGGLENFFQKVVRRVKVVETWGENQNNNGISQTGVEPVGTLTFYTVVTSPDVLPLSCRRLVGAKPIN